MSDFRHTLIKFGNKEIPVFFEQTGEIWVITNSLASGTLSTSSRIRNQCDKVRACMKDIPDGYKPYKELSEYTARGIQVISTTARTTYCDLKKLVKAFKYTKDVFHVKAFNDLKIASLLRWEQVEKRPLENGPPKKRPLKKRKIAKNVPDMEALIKKEAEITRNLVRECFGAEVKQLAVFELLSDPDTQSEAKEILVSNNEEQTAAHVEKANKEYNATLLVNFAEVIDICEQRFS